MFEKIVTDIIVKYLGEYIQDLDRENLKIGLFKGHVRLTNLQVRG